MDKATYKKAVHAAGVELYKAQSAMNRIALAANEMRDILYNMSSHELEALDQSTSRVLDILTILENHVYLAATDSSFLIALFEVLDEVMIATIVEGLEKERLLIFKKIIDARLEPFDE